MSSPVNKQVVNVRRVDSYDDPGGRSYEAAHELNTTELVVAAALWPDGRWRAGGVPWTAADPSTIILHIDDSVSPDDAPGQVLLIG